MFWNKRKKADNIDIIGIETEKDRKETGDEVDGFKLGRQMDKNDVQIGSMYYICGYGIAKIMDVYDATCGFGVRKMGKFMILFSTCSFKEGTTTTAYIDDHLDTGGHRIFELLAS